MKLLRAWLASLHERRAMRRLAEQRKRELDYKRVVQHNLLRLGVLRTTFGGK